MTDSIEEIGSYAFYGCSELSNITLYDGISTIADHTFYGCSKLQSIEIPDSIQSIGSYAFSDCTTLANLIIADSVESIGTYAFQNCENLTCITLPDSIETISSYAFKGCRRLFELYNLSGLSLKTGSAENGYVAYYAQIIYTSEAEERRLRTEGDYTFLDNGSTRNLISYHGTAETLILPEIYTEINAYAFQNCSNLTSIAIPSSVTSIGDYAFEGCNNLTAVTFGEHSKLTSIGSYAFYGCSGLTSIIIPDSVTSIDSSAFEGCSGLTSLTLPFVGATLNGTTNTHFGYIFGASSYSYKTAWGENSNL